MVGSTILHNLGTEGISGRVETKGGSFSYRGPAAGKSSLPANRDRSQNSSWNAIPPSLSQAVEAVSFSASGTSPGPKRLWISQRPRPICSQRPASGGRARNTSAQIILRALTSGWAGRIGFRRSPRVSRIGEELLAFADFPKIVLARPQNQHARRVRYPAYAATSPNSAQRA